jgi:riboflavin biosynthesis pyrimidine reductase
VKTGHPPVPVGFEPGFVLLFDDAAPGAGRSLPGPFRELYCGDWIVPDSPRSRPHTVVNFVASRDGRISYAEPSQIGGAAVSGGSAADIWLMALLRARCDAVLVGDGTVRAEPDHLWTPEFLGTHDTAAFAWLRSIEGRSPAALHVVCSATGEIDPAWAVVGRDDVHLVIATTTAGAAMARARLSGRPNTEVVDFGAERVDTNALGRWLASERDVAVLLCEGGPGLYGSLLVDGAVDEEFLTLSPRLVGSEASSGTRRPSLVEGVGFDPASAPRSVPISLRRAGEHLMLRSRIVTALR